MKYNNQDILLFCVICILLLVLVSYIYTNSNGVEAFVVEEPATIINPPEDKREYSSSWNDNHKKSTLDSELAWNPNQNNKSQWMQINLDNVKNVSGVITQGRKDYSQWVTSYYISYYIIDPDLDSDSPTEDYKYITDNDGNNKLFGGNYDINTKIENEINPPIKAQYIRIHPQSWQNHISMRAGVVVLPDTTTANPTTTFANPTTTYANPTTTYANPSTTYANPTTTYANPSTTKYEPTRTPYMPPTNTTYQEVPTPVLTSSSLNAADSSNPGVSAYTYKDPYGIHVVQSDYEGVGNIYIPIMNS